MALYGYWMNKAGRYHRIEEHGRALIANPKKYGLDPEAVTNLVGQGGVKYRPQESDVGSIRHKLYEAAMRNGWVRIRGGAGNYSVQFFGDAKRVAKNLLESFLSEEAGSHATIVFNDLSFNKAQTYTIQELQEAYDNDMFTSSTGAGITARKNAGVPEKTEKAEKKPAPQKQVITPSHVRDFKDVRGVDPTGQNVRDIIRKRLERKAGFATENINESVKHIMTEMGLKKVPEVK